MPTFGFEVTRKRVLGAVKHGAMKVWHCGPVSFWWTDGKVSDELEKNATALQRGIEAVEGKLRLVRSGASDR